MLNTLAQVSSESIPFLDFINLGVIVSVLIAILSKKLVPGWAYEEKKAQAEKAEAQVEALRNKIEGEILPALLSTTNVLTQVANQSRTNFFGKDEPR